jgi:hypothetical protein
VFGVFDAVPFDVVAKVTLYSPSAAKFTLCSESVDRIALLFERIRDLPSGWSATTGKHKQQTIEACSLIL